MDDNTSWVEPNMSFIAGLESKRVIQIPQFLPKHEHDALFEAVCSNQQAFQCAGNSDVNIDGPFYLAVDSMAADLPGADAVLEACKSLSNRIQSVLPQLFEALGVEHFPVSEVPLTLLNGLNGHYGCPHNDESGGRFKISILYYFHGAPKAFSGGDLEFYNTDLKSPNNHSDKPIASVDYEDNLLIAFPSQVFHGITEVFCNSNKFEDGRFVVIGFLGPQ